MLIALAIALQIAETASKSSTFGLRSAGAEQRVPIVASASGPMLRPEWLAPILPTTLVLLAPGHYRHTVAGVSYALETGVPSVAVDGQLRQLAAAPFERNRLLFVPLQLVSEVMPAYLPNVLWDADARQLFVGS